MDTMGDRLEEFLRKMKEVEASMQKVNILVCGKTGVGKSTLINAVFRENLAETGVGVPVTKHLCRIEKEGVPISLLDTRGLELDAKAQEETRKEILGEIDRALKTGKPEEHIHLLWYCVNSGSGRLEDFETEWIRSFSEKVKVVLVLTQSYAKEHERLKKTIEEMNLPIGAVVSVLAQDFEITPEFKVAAHGLEGLVDASLQCIPEAFRMAFINAQRVDLKRKLAQANREVVFFISTAFATGFSPIPLSDAPLLIANEFAMIAQLTSVFGLPLERSFVQAVLTAVAGSAGATVLGKFIVSNLMKLVPVLEPVSGMISGSTAAMLTAALGYGYNEVMMSVVRRTQAGEKIKPEEIVSAIKSQFEKQMAKGKDLLKGIRFGNQKQSE